MLVKRSYFHDSLYDTFSAIVDVKDIRYSIVQFSIYLFWTRLPWSTFLYQYSPYYSDVFEPINKRRITAHGDKEDQLLRIIST